MDYLVPTDFSKTPWKCSRCSRNRFSSSTICKWMRRRRMLQFCAKKGRRRTNQQRERRNIWDYWTVSFEWRLFGFPMTVVFTLLYNGLLRSSYAIRCQKCLPGWWKEQVADSSHDVKQNFSGATKKVMAAIIYSIYTKVREIQGPWEGHVSLCTIPKSHLAHRSNQIVQEGEDVRHKKCYRQAVRPLLRNDGSWKRGGWVLRYAIS